MKWPKNAPRHECCPKEWRNTPNFTGNHELDAVIYRNSNKDIPNRMALYAGLGGRVYGDRTGYTGYHRDPTDD